MRLAYLWLALATALLCASCQKTPADKQREQAKLDAEVAEKLARERAADAQKRAESERESREAAQRREEDIRKESADAFARFAADRPKMSPVEEAQALDAAVARVRARMDDPPAMQVRNVRFNAAKDAVCMEVNYTQGGKYLGFRGAFVMPDVIWVEPNPDEVSHRVFQLNMQRLGCDEAATAKSKQ